MYRPEPVPTMVCLYVPVLPKRNMSDPGLLVPARSANWVALGMPVLESVLRDPSGLRSVWPAASVTCDACAEPKMRSNSPDMVVGKVGWTGTVP